MKETLALFQRIANNLLEQEEQAPVAPYVPTERLLELLDLGLEAEGVSEERLESVLQELVLRTPRTATTGFFNQLFGGRNDKAVLGDLLSVMLNNSMYTYKAAGPQVGVEKEIIQQLNNRLGWEEGGGTFGPGGSMTNFMSMLMARDARDGEVRYKGVHKSYTVYTSTESHYSVPKNAAFAGIGRDQVRYVPVDDQGRMIPQELRQMIEADLHAGYLPVLINATAGTTVLGAFDPIEPLAIIARKFNIWLHVDGAYCGAVLLSSKYKHLIAGIEQVDSFSVNAHKMLGTPLSCSMLLVKDKKWMYRSFSNDASYLYQTDHDEFNLGKTSLQCGRRNDALKLWTLWKFVGTKGLEAIVDKQFQLADVARDYIKDHPDYQLYSFDESISVCFNYKGIPAKELCTALYESAQLLVGYGSFNDVEFVRLVTINAQNSPEVILDFFQTLEQYVAQHADRFSLSV